MSESTPEQINHSLTSLISALLSLIKYHALQSRKGWRVSNFLAEIDKKLEAFSKSRVHRLTVLRGSLDRLGRLEKSRSWHTDYRSGTLGKVNDSGWFGAGTRGSSDRQEIIQHTINLMQIGPNFLTDVNIFSTAVFDTMREGVNVACIFSGDKQVCYYVSNFTDGISFGVQPDWSRLAMSKWIAGAIGVIAIMTSFGSITSLSVGTLIGLGIGVLALLAARGYDLALKRSHEIWQQAIQLVSTP